MGYRSLSECVADLQRTGQLVAIDDEIDPYLEAAQVQRRVYRAQGPAVLFRRVKGCAFPLVSNLFGTLERTRFLFRDTLRAVQRLIALKADPASFWKNPWQCRDVPGVLWNMRPKWVKTGPVLAHETTLSRLPQIVCWPGDGGPFITLPQVYTENADRPGWRHSNLGMYRIQLAGNEYAHDSQAGLHYQIHRGIGVHHAAALRQGIPLRVNVFVGGPPAMTLAAVMPLPEGMPEIAFAGALGGRRVRLIAACGIALAGGAASAKPQAAADADFCITGVVDSHLQLPEGPFGDHLGYYSLKHPFPVLHVEKVWHRDGAIWPFTVVGRPPQEDTSFGQFIHELTGPVIPTLVPGVHAVHAVDAAGVHPLLLAIGSERYVPFAQRRKPQELLTSANALLGQGQLSLAKYLFIVAREDDPSLDVHDVPAFLRHLLERADWQTDLHFQTCTTIDTLDYSGPALNEGSKLVIAAAGPPRRALPTQWPANLRLPDGFAQPRVVLPGVLVVQTTGQGDKETRRQGDSESDSPCLPVSLSPCLRFCDAFTPQDAINAFPWIVLVDDSEFTARSVNNFLWVTFTRSNPAADVYGIGAFTRQKHWGCAGALVIDACRKPHHAPPLIEDPAVSRRVDALAAPGRPLHGILA